MPRLISEVNSGGGAIGIASDGIDLGNMKNLIMNLTELNMTQIVE